MLFFGQQVAQRQLGALVLREVDDDLVALGHPVPEVGDHLRLGHEAGVGPDHDHRHRGATVVHLQGVGARHRRVEDPEPVLPRLHVHHRPRHAVDQEDVTVDPGLAVVVEDEAPVGREGRVTQYHGHVVHRRRRVGTAGDPEAGLDGVVQDVHRRQPVVGVLRGVVHAVVVVPERASRLAVRVEVGLHLAGEGDVGRVAVVLRQRRGAVQVGRGRPLPRVRRVLRGHLRVLVRRGRRPLQAVGLPHHHGAALVHPQRRAGHEAVVAEDRRLEARQDLQHPERLHHVVAGVPAGDPVRALHVPPARRPRLRRPDERERELGGQLARGHPARGRLRQAGSFQWQGEGRSPHHADLEQVAARQIHGVFPPFYSARPPKRPPRGAASVSLLDRG